MLSKMQLFLFAMVLVAAGLSVAWVMIDLLFSVVR